MFEAIRLDSPEVDIIADFFYLYGDSDRKQLRTSSNRQIIAHLV